MMGDLWYIVYKTVLFMNKPIALKTCLFWRNHVLSELAISTTHNQTVKHCVCQPFNS
jgi:hypothetical protein